MKSTALTGRRQLLMAAGVAWLMAAATVAQGQEPLLTFAKSFNPEIIGPGSVATLRFDITNQSMTPVTDLAFADVLPAEITLAAPAFVSNGCAGALTAPDGGSTITLQDGVVGAGLSCVIVVNVTASVPSEGPYTNISGDLTSSAGNSGPATADLTVDENLPGFTKSFAPSTVEFGGRSTLTFSIDNTTECGECAPDIVTLSFADTLPPGMVVASPAFASTDCGNPLLPPTLTAVPGSSVISLVAPGTAGFPAVASESTCTVTVDVIGGAVGRLGNVSGELLATISNEQSSAGKAAAVLEVTGFDTLLALGKKFIDDPVAPGGTVTAEFTVTNKSRSDSATGITFNDDLEATLTGLTPTLPPTPDPPCGAGSSLAFGMGVLTLSGGSLPPGSSCTFSVELSVPAGAVPGAYANTAGPVSGDVGGSPVTGNQASDLLFVVSFPILTKEFTDDPVGAGGTVTLEFTITNTSPLSTLSAIGFIDELTDNSGALGGVGVGNGFLPFPVTISSPTLPTAACGGTLSLVSLGTDRQGLELTGGSLSSAGMMGDSCAFSVTVDIPEGLAGGTYTNTTEEISAVLDDVGGTPKVVGPPASDDLAVVAAPRLTKEFTDDPAVPGGTVTLVFTLENRDPDNAASAIAFSDDLGATLTGLTLTSVIGNTCGGAVAGVGTDMFSYTGGTLAAEASCTITLELTVPGMVGGTFGNTTSQVTSTVAGLTAVSPAARDNLVVAGLLLSKEFTDDPVIPGDTATLRFTLENAGADDATSITFTDDLAAILPGTPDLTVVTTLPISACGGTLSAAGSSFLIFSGGTVLSGDPPCSFDVTVLVPAAADDGSYINKTNSLSSSVGTGPPAVDRLVVDSELLGISKEFTDDPVQPGDPVTLEFKLTNLSATYTVTDIAFGDDLDAALSGLKATGAILNNCGGMAAGFPAGLFEYSGGSLLPGASCTIRISVDVPPAPLPGSVFPNTTTGVTGRVGALDVVGAPGKDNLKVQLLTFTTSFDGPTTATGNAVLSFTISNLDSTAAYGNLAFSDDLTAVISGLVATLPPTPDPPCGPGSALAGTSFLTLTGGILAAAGSPADSCTFAVTVTVPAMASDGSFPNTTSGLFQFGITVADPATALLTIEAPPLFGKAFVPASIAIGLTSTLTFTIDNTASGLAATSLDFTDNLPAGTTVAAVPNAANTCGGTLTAMSGASLISLTGGTVGAGATCTIDVDIVGIATGIHVNTTGDLTSSSGNSGTASNTLTVLDVTPPQVTTVATSAGALAECDTAQLEISTFLVTFSESVYDPPGDTDPDDVTNPANYQVIAAGPDADFATTACGTVFPDDVPVPILSVNYDDGGPTATLNLSEPLPSSQIRLLVCGSTSIHDLAGNPLDGTGDGTGGDDFVLTFRSDPFNLLTNGHFDCDAAGWVLTSSTPGEIFHSSADVDNSAVSGSLEFMQFGVNTDFEAAQCAEFPSDAETHLTAVSQLTADPGVQLSLTAGCTSYASVDCSGPSLGVSSITSIFGDSGGSWLSIGLTVTERPGRQSIRCSFKVGVPDGDDFTLRLDSAVLEVGASIFADGFESGDTSEWSATVGGSL